MAVSRVFRSKFGGSHCAMCGGEIKKGNQITITNLKNDKIGRWQDVGRKRWVHARCRFKGEK